MKITLLFPLLIALLSSSYANESILLQRIVALEKKVIKLEEKLAPVLEEERVKEIVKTQQAQALERIMIDGDLYARHDLQIIEKLYQTANEDWKGENVIKAVDLLIERYPQANRTGIAALTLAQTSEGSLQIELLKKAIGPFSNCYYSNGVQVGPYARLYLGMLYKKEGKEEKANSLFKELRAQHPNAIDHHGQLLSSHLEGME